MNYYYFTLPLRGCEGSRKKLDQASRTVGAKRSWVRMMCSTGASQVLCLLATVENAVLQLWTALTGSQSARTPVQRQIVRERELLSRNLRRLPREAVQIQYANNASTLMFSPFILGFLFLSEITLTLKRAFPPPACDLGCC